VVSQGREASGRRRNAVRPECPRPPRTRIRYPAQALDKLMYVVRPLHDAQCRCVITFDGHLDGERMAQAVKLSLRAAPILACRYVLGSWRSRWECCPDHEPAAAFSQVQTQDPRRELNDFMARPLDPMLAPQVAVRVVRADQDTLGLKLNHMVADAAGLLDCIRLLASIYRRLQVDPSYEPPAGDGGDRGTGQVFRRAGLRAMIEGCLRLRYPRSPWGIPAISADLSGQAFPIRRVGPDRVARLKAYGNAKHVTFTDVLLTAFFRGLTAILAPQAGARLPVQSTVDLRRYLPGGRADAICDLAGVYYPVIRHDPHAGFEQTLGNVRDATAKARAGHPWLGGALFLELANHLPTAWQLRLAQSVFARERSSGKARPFFANLGAIDPCGFDFGDVTVADLEIFGPLTFPPNLLITTYTFRDTLSITSGYCDSAVDPQLVDRFLDRFLAELPA
jgi:NRPS condensation-like uncharacterized protein